MNRIFRFLDRFSSVENERSESVYEENQSPQIIACSSPVVEEDREKNVDVLIIGGGIVGVSVALFLARKKKNLKIQVLERGYVGSEASGLSAGTIWAAGYGDRSHAGLLLGQMTVELLEELSKKKDVDFEFERSGAFSIAASPDQVKRQSNSVRSLVPHGYEGQMLVGREAVLKQFPGLGENTTVIGASTWPLSCHVNPKALTHVIAEEAENLGVYISEETPVTEIRCLHKSGEENDEEYRYEVQAENGSRWHAKHIVVAAGAWVKPLGTSLGLRFPVVPVKGQMWITEEAPLSAMRSLIFTTESHVWWSKNSSRDDKHGIPEYCTHDFQGNLLCRHAYGRQTRDGQIIFGGDRVRCEPDDYTVDEKDLERNIEYVREFFPNVGNYSLAGTWAGIMGFSVDGKPLVGELNELGYPGLWLAAGFGPHGIMEGPGAARALADMICRDSDQEMTNMMKYFRPCRHDGVKREF